ncbi:MAG: hypothetical protein LC751_18815 [Actinobacteria bacterium]|jgi:hypothetical protein|nr:hypothetical protein [Actinomycetota bacterium]MCA1739491.1 hypothetical protein [Actinomycetota bacterium]
MKATPPHLKALEEVEQHGLPGLMEVMREEGTDAVRYVLWTTTSWHLDYNPTAWSRTATIEQKRKETQLT